MLTFNTKSFHWNKAESLFTADISELRDTEGQLIEIGERPREFLLESNLTGRKIRMTLTAIDDDDDCSGGYRALDYSSTDSHIQFFVTLFND